MRNLRSSPVAIGPAALLLLAGCVEKVPAGTNQSGAAMNGTYGVTAINGRAPAPAVGRGNAYEVILMETGISVSLGCSNISVSGVVADGVFRASDPVAGGVVTGAGACGIPAEQQWEPRLHRSLLAGEVRVTRRAKAVTLAAPNLIVEGRSR
ncbi:MAG TPA: hypothetical protein VEZ70_15035 [Allosphingosinicella sp.]|nr:hypothetical protein [Allosphingosinicella sp.]